MGAVKAKFLGPLAAVVRSARPGRARARRPVPLPVVLPLAEGARACEVFEQRLSQLRAAVTWWRST
eukprot:3933182-Rhodomonas_salina.1